MRKTLYVSPNQGQWIVHWEHDASGHVFSKKEDAIRNARNTAGSFPAGYCSQIKVQRADGTFQTEWTYGQDPYPPRG